ncbi:MAG: hypothetical protein QF614_08455, partial [SAR324 cluster bacterium]|nr:hypothetical protein [SAR324 cluster bacterium]
METDLLMSPNFDLTCVVPRSGRTLRNFLHRLVGLGANAEEIAQIVRIIDVSKGSSTPDLPAVLETFRNITRDAPPCFSVFV